MAEAELSGHAREMLRERGISEEWMHTTLNSAESEETDEEGNIHYIRAIPEYEGRVLHVVVNPNTDPHKVVTLFFDRRLRRPL